MQAWNTNNLHKMEECLGKKIGCSTFRTTTSIYIDWKDKGHKKWRDNTWLSRGFAETDLGIIGNHQVNYMSKM